MAADAGDRQSRRGHDRDAPSGGSGSRLTEVDGFGLSAPAPQRETDRAASLGAELETPGGGHVESRDFTDNRAETAMPQAFLDTCEHGLVVAGLDIDHAIGRQTRLRKRRGEEIGSRDDPENLAFRARRDPGGEERSGRAVHGAVAAASDLMERAERETTAWKTGVDVGDSERKDRFDAPGSAFDLLDLRAQRLYGGLVPQAPSRPPGVGSISCSLNVLPFEVGSQEDALADISLHGRPRYEGEALTHPCRSGAPVGTTMRTLSN